MTELLPDLVFQSALRTPDAPALSFGDKTLSYGELAGQIRQSAASFVRMGIGKSERVAIYLEKRLENVVAMFGAAAAGAVFVPVNPLLRPQQVRHILRDCNVRILVTSESRLASLSDILSDCPDLNSVVSVDGPPAAELAHIDGLGWSDLFEKASAGTVPHSAIDRDMAAIIYTSGSTGLPKGVVLSHRNMVAGARSVSQYLENTPDDRILSVLPLSFDAGLSQLTTAFNVGASVILMNFLLPKDVVVMAGKVRATGIAGVPPLWNQLAGLEWPAEAAESVRYFTNTGGHMPRPTLDRLRRAMPNAAPYLMYGLTEAFRSTYLPPSEVDNRPDSMGRAIPNAEILVVRGDGSLCAPGEPGELVHRGALVALGYWNDPDRTSERFKPAPGQDPALPITELAVWSGDTVRMDEDGFLYFVGRQDEMIKTSGYRVSPTEVEEIIYASGLVSEAVAIGVPHETQGQAIVIVATPPPEKPADEAAVLAACRKELPPFMVPQRVVLRDALPRNPNGKIDRKRIASELEALFKDCAA
ncbi:MAG: acyl-CoA ligase (AMP-forming), exosortase A system-associated [Rhodospirillaceae bacterium]|jgi:acyl-CoA ligase (AMP-forming) (exosortase A-associated)|nr:acyl-CoA ligase (AMP-forming), exosortase A system-associated [Rhodospirillaceae bacterium]